LSAILITKDEQRSVLPVQIHTPRGLRTSYPSVWETKGRGATVAQTLGCLFLQY